MWPSPEKDRKRGGRAYEAEKGKAGALGEDERNQTVVPLLGNAVPPAEVRRGEAREDIYEYVVAQVDSKRGCFTAAAAMNEWR